MNIKNITFYFLFIILIISLLPYHLSAQNFIQSEKVWSYAPPITSNGGVQQGDTAAFAFTEDSIEIDGQYYRAVCNIGQEFPNYQDFCQSLIISGYFYIREENNGKVFLKLYNQPEILKYDFSIQENDYFDFLTNFDPLTYSSKQLISIDTISDLLGNSRARYTFEDDFDIWIEGIGSINSIYPIVHTDNTLICYKETIDTLSYLNYIQDVDSIILGSEGQCFYAVVSNEDILESQEFTISPNPFNDQLTIDASFNLISENINIYDALGRMIDFTIKGNNTINTTDWTKGIYYIFVEEKENYLVEKVVKM